MNKSFNLEYTRNLAAGFVVDDLTPEENEEFRRLLEIHPEIIAEIDDLQEVLRQVVDGFTEVEAPTHLLSKILEQVEVSQEESLGRTVINNAEVKQTNITANQTNINNTSNTSNINNNSPFRLFALSRTKIAIGVTALFALFISIDNYRLRHNLSIATGQNQELQRNLNQAQVVKSLLQNSQTRLFTLQGVNSTKSGSGRMIVNPKQQKALMLFQNLPAPPAGNAYVLWTVVDSKKIHCGKVKPYSWGNASYEVPFTDELYEEFYHPEFSGIILTLEKDPNVSRPTGTVIMRSSQI
ncbi:MAG: anti-sigma factor domain-containing protein [Mastigocoleus sp.]